MIEKFERIQYIFKMLFGVRVLYLNCDTASIVGIIVGILLTIGSVLTYIPQFREIFKSKTIYGLSELSIILLGVGGYCLTMNSAILNWHELKCFDKCDFWICNARLLPVYQIFVGWVMVFIYYVIFIVYKIKESDDRMVSDARYFIVYIGFVVIISLMVLAQELLNTGISESLFFNIFGQSMGYISAVCNAIVWIPQIYTLLKIKKIGNVSPLMFILQTPGNIITIIFQAVLYKQSVSTWITYVINCVEQAIILTIICIYWFRDRKLNQQLIEIVSEEYYDFENFAENDEPNLSDIEL